MPFANDKRAVARDVTSWWPREREPAMGKDRPGSPGSCLREPTATVPGQPWRTVCTYACAHRGALATRVPVLREASPRTGSPGRSDPLAQHLARRRRTIARARGEQRQRDRPDRADRRPDLDQPPLAATRTPAGRRTMARTDDGADKQANSKVLVVATGCRTRCGELRPRRRRPQRGKLGPRPVRRGRMVAHPAAAPLTAIQPRVRHWPQLLHLPRSVSSKDSLYIIRTDTASARHNHSRDHSVGEPIQIFVPGQGSHPGTRPVTARPTGRE